MKLNIHYFLVMAMATPMCLAQPPAMEKVMITEVSWGDPEGIEIANFSMATVDLSQWTVRWDDGILPGVKVSSALGTSIAPGEILLVLEAMAGAPAETPPGTQILSILPALGTSNGAFKVSLVNGLGASIDELRVTDTAGAPGAPAPGFRGAVRRGLVSGLVGAVSVERIWGLESDGSGDWTEQPNRSFGLENRSSGPRSIDPAAISQVLLSEIDNSPDFVELFNGSGVVVDLRDWFLLVSVGQGATPTRITPFPQLTQVPVSGHLVIGNNGTLPSELPVSVPYINLSAVNGGTLSFTTEEFTCALYNQLGQLVDLVRTSGHDDTVVHNHPRLPSLWSDFVGVAGRNSNNGAGAIGREPGSDSNSGSDWRPVFARTLGAANTGFGGSPGHNDALDVRLHETGIGNGLTLIVNAGASASGARFSFFFSLGHLQGTGAFIGLGFDALANWLAVLATPPFSGLLDAEGSARVDFAPGIVPPGIQLDCIFILEQPIGYLSARTLILEYDT